MRHGKPALRLVPAAFAAVLGGSIAWAGQAPPTASPPPAAQPPPPDPKAILEGVCTSCHGVDFIADHRKDRDGWDFTVHRMIDKGADLGPDEADLLVDYLAKTYPKPTPGPASAAAGPGAR